MEKASSVKTPKLISFRYLSHDIPATRTLNLKDDLVCEVPKAVNKKLGLIKAPEQIIRELAGWLSHEEAQELRKTVEIFDKVNEGDWD